MIKQFLFKVLNDIYKRCISYTLRWSVLSVGVMFVSYSFCETNRIDSLKTTWKNEFNGQHERFHALKQLVYLYKNLNIDSALHYSKLEYEFGVQNNITEIKIAALNNIAMVYQAKGKLEKALIYYAGSLELKDPTKHFELYDATYNNVGVIYKNLGRYDQALACYNTALDFHSENRDTVNIASILINIGIVYKKMDQSDSSIVLFRKSLLLSEYICDKEGVVDALYQIGSVYFERDNDLALFYFDESYKLAKELNNQADQVNSLTALGEFYKRRGEYHKGMSYFKKGLDAAIASGNRKDVMYVNKQLYEVYQLAEKYDSSLFQYESYIQIRDSIDEKSAKRKVLEMEQIHLQKEKAIADSLNFIQQLEFNQINERNRISLFSILAVFVFMFVLIYYKVKRTNHISETERLLQQIQLLKAEMLINKKYKQANAEILEAQLNRDKINSNIHFPLNDSDWRILNALFDNPNINNREIAEVVFLSVEGVRSSLKKMYRLFNVQKADGPQRINLLVKATKASIDN